MSRIMPSLHLSERNHFLDSNKCSTNTHGSMLSSLYWSKAYDLKILKNLASIKQQQYFPLASKQQMSIPVILLFSRAFYSPFKSFSLKMAIFILDTHSSKNPIQKIQEESDYCGSNFQFHFLPAYFLFHHNCT